jgi:hypothetical protein
LSPIAETTLIGGGFTIIGVLIGSFFRNAFIIQLNFLKYNVNSGSGDTSNIGEYLKAHYVKSHLVAFEVFRNYLSIKERKAIDKAWIEYCNFNQYSNNKDLALKNLEDVLEFAKHK